MIAGIDHVQLAAPPGSEEEARRFFGGVLGLEELPKPEPLAAHGGAWFACGGQQLHVGIEPEFTPAGKAHPAFAVDGAERLAAVAARLGARRRRGHLGPGGPGQLALLRQRPVGQPARVHRGLSGLSGLAARVRAAVGHHVEQPERHALAARHRRAARASVAAC